jgi:hypothetical protein
MANPLNGPLGRFIVKVLSWLPATFAVWYFAAPVLLWPVRLLAELVARVGLADLVDALEQNGAMLTFVTTLKAGSATAASGQLAVDVDMLVYSLGLPLFAALVLAAREPGWLRRLVAGYAVLVPFITWGVLADFLKNVASRRARSSHRRRDSSRGAKPSSHSSSAR